jgi:Arc/MetJ-type ribon-helix-helix transcriptional regulator
MSPAGAFQPGKWEFVVTERIVSLKLNQQQLELLDLSVARGEAQGREDLVRRALREFAERHLPAAENAKGAA